ncbi:hypothetical protein [Xenorhabdus miraniensis]|uniref:Uncharacterized protein n=1 Tax=Xenorhabdus miraniensis TaxID=351674 RepID=A0A2D0JLC7_9GAMM|nr:hypothetical protein [Xenorhabdus miraniensis]PHM47116.1 hypothetical protein Xmir_03535 [Xenorhabdus miraniensis]
MAVELIISITETPTGLEHNARAQGLCSKAEAECVEYIFQAVIQAFKKRSGYISGETTINSKVLKKGKK